ncbi:MAG: sensor histidine kinase [Candidatus Eiseniibacteriota bacterium]
MQATRAARRAALSLRVRLLLLLALAMLPAVILAIINTRNRLDRDIVEARHTVRTLNLVASGRHREALAATEAMLTILSRLPEVRRSEQPACRKTLQQVIGQFAGRYANLFVLDADGHVTCSVLPASAKASYAEREYFRDARDKNSFTVSGFVTGDVTHQPLIVAAFPMTRDDGSFGGVVAASVSLYWFTSLADIFALPVGSTIFIVDDKGTAYAFDEKTLNRLPARERLLSAISAHETEFDTVGRNGERYLYALAELDSNRVFALSLVPIETALDRASSDVLLRIVEISVFCFFAILAVWIGAYFLFLRPLRNFYKAAAAYREGDFSYHPASADQPAELRDLAQKFSDMAHGIQGREERLQALINQRDLLVQEIHHRVKNNLQIVSSLLSLQAKRIKVPASRREFEVARERVDALALLHRHLYEQRDAASIDVKLFIERLVRHLIEAYLPAEGRRVEASVDVADIRVPPSIVVPLGLIIAEAISNALKHAFPDGRPGRIRVMLRVDGARATLAVSDDGVADAGFDDGDGGLGTTLMQGFAAQLEGDIAIVGDGGMVVTVTFPLVPMPLPADA